MKKGNLAVLLTFPFVVAFLSVTAIVGRLTSMAKDITDIEWAYDVPSGFKVGVETPLIASAIYDERFELAHKNRLVWTVRNADPNDLEPHAQIIAPVDNDPTVQGTYYIKGLSKGDVVLTVANEKNTVFKSTTVAIYEKFALFASPVIPNSNSNIDPNIYYGEYDIDPFGNKSRAKVAFSLSTIPASGSAKYSVVSTSMNAHFDLDTQTLEIGEIAAKTEQGSFKVRCTLAGETEEREVPFIVVKDGMNVYDYDQLLACTNRSVEGEIVVLRKNFESLDKFAQLDSEGGPILQNGIPVAKKTQTALFGHYAGWTDGRPVFTFESEVYPHLTSMSTGYIDQWNAFAQESGRAMLSKYVLAGLHIQKDFYGNGYSLNMHDLTYPRRVTRMASGDIVPALGPENLFRGPLFSYCLGDPSQSRLIGLYGQDNAAIYLHGDNITVNDINIRNCDFGNHLSDLNYVGNVVDVEGSSNKIVNSRLSSGKSVVRAYSCADFTLKNCMLQNSYNFLLDVGSNKQLPLDETAPVGRSQEALIDYLYGEGDGVQNAYLAQDINYLKSMANVSGMSFTGIKNAMRSLSSAMSRTSELGDAGFDGSVRVEDCLFYHSGVASIGSEANFNGPFLYAQIPSLVSMIFTLLANVPSAAGDSIVPYVPVGLALNSYPVEVSLAGETEFFDYKRLDEVNLGGLLYEEIGLAVTNALQSIPAAAGLVPSGMDLTNVGLDDVFPLKSVWDVRLKNTHRYYTPEDDADHPYGNMVSFFFGGGPNLSKIVTDEWTSNTHGYKEFDEDLVEFFTTSRTGTDSERYWRLVWRLVQSFIGYQPFKFGYMDGSGYNYGEAPSVNTLMEKATAA